VLVESCGLLVAQNATNPLQWLVVGPEQTVDGVAETVVVSGTFRGDGCESLRYRPHDSVRSHRYTVATVPMTVLTPAAELVAIAALAVLCLCAQTQDMGTKTIGLREEVYERLKSHKREDESFTELVNRLLDETATDWREGFGTLPEQDARELEAIVADSRAQTSEGLSGRQREALREFVDRETENETA